MRCFNCHRTGHLSRDCVGQSGNAEARPSADVPSPTSKRIGGLVTGETSPQFLNNSSEFLRPTLQVGTFYVSSQIDTGAQESFISLDLAQQLSQEGICMYGLHPDFSVSLADGHYLQMEGHIDTSVDFHGHKIYTTFHVVRDLPVPILIGRDLLERCEVEISFRTQTLTVGRLPFQGQVPSGTLEKIAGIVPEQKNHILRVLENVANVFRDKPGLTAVAEHRINTGSARPIFQNPYPLAQDKLREVRTLVQEMLDAGYIEPSDSPWASPIVLVKKKNGKTRFCVDYRRLNNLTADDRFPLPLISSIIQKVGQAGIWTTLDLASGYWQMRVAVEDRPKTSFILEGCTLWNLLL